VLTDHADLNIEGLTIEQINVGDILPSLTIEVSATTIILGALASRDWRPMHHDRDFAIQRNGTKDIFMNTPNQAAWLERFITDWTGPTGRLGGYKFRMIDSVFPGDTVVFKGFVEAIDTDDVGCAWVKINALLTVNDKTMTQFFARVAVPIDARDNPWRRGQDDWHP